jgi:chaperonin GroES
MNTQITNFVPLFNKCLIQRILNNQITKGGIYLTEKLINEKSKLGKVISIGKGDYNENGKFIPTSLKPGDIVLLPDYKGTQIDFYNNNKKYLYEIYKENDILGIVKNYKH